MESYSIRSDVAKNRLYVSLNGFVADEELLIGVEKTIQEINKLKPGFSVINDISNFKAATPAGVEGIKRAQQYAKEKGAKRIIRVVGKEALASMQFARTSRTAGYEADTASSVSEAEKLLEG